MQIDLGGTLRHAEEFLRRHWKSKAVREAEKRRRERKAREAARRAKRAGLVAGTSGAGLLAWGVAVAPIAGPALVAAGAATLLAAAAALAWPSRRSGRFSQAELEALPGQAEDWLLERRESLPAAAAPLIDAVLRSLGDLQPHLGAVPPASTLAWEARRLLGDHLPRLLLAWCELPQTAREDDPAQGAQLIEGLTAISEGLEGLCKEVCRTPLMHFETQGRFLSSRYRDPPALGNATDAS